MTAAGGSVDSARIARLLRRLTALPMRSRKALAPRAESERLLMSAVRQGLRAAERAIAAVNALDRRLVLVEKPRFFRKWREELHDGRHALEITALANRDIRSVHVLYRSIPKLTTRQHETHAIQQAFYARYLAVGQRAYRDSALRLSADDRLLLLVGELEADVNNGGFAQYLSNKGGRRARAALAALRAIGARETARMLERALAPGAAPALWSALDDRFYEESEDLAALAARHLKLAA
jgi:hypothetical protein